MQINGMMGGFFKLATWLMNLAYLHVLWLLFTISGIVFLGLFPATAAMYNISRKWIHGENDVAIFHTFWSYFKQAFVKSNLTGWVISLFGLFLYADFKFVFTMSGGIWSVISTFLIVVSFVYILMLFYVFPVLVQFELNTIQIIKNSFLYMILNIKYTIMMVLGAFVFYLIWLISPGIILVLGGGLFSLYMMWCANRAFDNVMSRRGKLAE